MNGSLVPANAKKSMLVMGFLRPLPDIPVLAVGVSITLIGLLFMKNADFWMTILICMPALISVGLVLPIPNYHNAMTAIGVIIRFYSTRRIYYWKGWCSKDEFKE